MQKIISIGLLTTAFIGINATSANASREYLRNYCFRALQQYRANQNSGTSVSGNMLEMQSLSTVLDCATRYANLVQQDRSYCNDAKEYLREISPKMRTSAIAIAHSCN